MAKEPKIVENAATSGVGESEAVSTGSGAESLRGELAEVRELARTLMAAVQDMRAQAARNELVRGAIEDVRADVRAASHAMLMTPAPVTAAEPRTAPGTPAAPGKGCGSCGCVSSDCCCFDIKVWQVRALKPQMVTEPGDIGDIPLLVNALEMQMYFTVDNIGVLIPGLGSTIDLRADGIPGGPGPWVVLDRVIQRVCIPRGSVVTKTIMCQAYEADEGAESVQGKGEFGEAMGSITLDCCMERIYPPVPVDIALNMGGEGRGIVQAAFYAERVCC
ncbi:hypothetical protein ACFQ1E_11850 [Sphingomonas canadensis]|uniref:Uncharacterized protein n=1 Tax=Sphingomonas canadensis TaxID=1219257 RepID=A0ABW3H6M5_9SPHN|nr:hypothetical protein [Sphingomonas canadensis]MCW3836833.1 hypothetical protein [Sphingomonas canadensis]